MSSFTPLLMIAVLCVFPPNTAFSATQKNLVVDFHLTGIGNYGDNNIFLYFKDDKCMSSKVKWQQNQLLLPYDKNLQIIHVDKRKIKISDLSGRLCQGDYRHGIRCSDAKIEMRISHAYNQPICGKVENNYLQADYKKDTSLPKKDKQKKTNRKPFQIYADSDRQEAVWQAERIFNEQMEELNRLFPEQTGPKDRYMYDQEKTAEDMEYELRLEKLMREYSDHLGTL